MISTMLTYNTNSIKFEDAKQTLATKEDMARLDIKITETKVDHIKWIVGFWIAQMAAIIGLYLNK
jgi:hypothetical protein